jgi:hypothetical protein
MMVDVGFNPRIAQEGANARRQTPRLHGLNTGASTLFVKLHHPWTTLKPGLETAIGKPGWEAFP